MIVKNIERYIHFAVDNGYRQPTPYWDYESISVSDNYIHYKKKIWWMLSMESDILLQSIKSKKFIEAIAIGVEKKHIVWWTRRMNINWITKYQEIAIRDWTLDTFIEQLLPKQPVWQKQENK